MIINTKTPRSMFLQIINDGNPVPFLVEYDTVTKKAVQLVRKDSQSFLVKDGEIVSQEIHLPNSFVLDTESGLPVVFPE